mmetsp:Transcript_4099/g.8265  ORF Transcript_4099/g.8265 Transcript_4099/m.8265 type:complete len:412 (-) Transcript_4099:89-1324(-)
MKFTAWTLAAAVAVTSSASAFTPTASSFVASRNNAMSTTTATLSFGGNLPHTPSTSLRGISTALSMSYTVGIVGATGAVGKEIRTCLETRNFPVSKLRIFGSERSAGNQIETEKYGDVTVELFDVKKARECDVVFLAVSGDFALEHAKAITEGDDGAVCIDNSSAFRYDKDIPLVVPEINGKETKKSKLIANPNCTTAIGLMALWPLHKLFGLKKVIMSTYQAASGAGQPGMDELQEGTRALLNGEKVENKIFAHPLPFNVIPHIDKFQENGYTKEEMKVTWETRKICGLPDDFPVSCTAVRIPTIRAHSESIVVETEKKVDVAAAKEALANAPGVLLTDDVTKNLYPMPMAATGQYDVQVGRVRKNLVFGDYGLEFFVCGDQLLRGAALNAVLVAEEMVNNGSLQAKVAA